MLQNYIGSVLASIRRHKCCRVHLVFFAILLMPLAGRAADPQFYSFSVAFPDDTIQCVRVSAEDDAEAKKPVIIWLNGSLPNPAVIRDANETWILPFCNFDYQPLLAQYDFVLFSAPHMPAVVSSQEIDENYQYKFTEAARNAYLDGNNPANLVARGNAVVDYLAKQPWVDARKIILLGHSQGANVGAYMAMNNDKIYALGYFSGNPLGRIAEMILTQRENARLKLVSDEQAQHNIDVWYRRVRKMCDDTYDDSQGDRNKTWTGFGRCYIDKMAQIKAHLFIAYGTEDQGGKTCDLLPIYLELGGKHDYQMDPFIGRGHNFEAVEQGKGNFDDVQWQKAIDDFAGWLGQLEQ